MKGRTAFLAINLLAIVISLLIGVKVLPGPDLIGTVLAFYVLFILPGLLLERLLFDAGGVSIEAICRIFGMGLVFVSLLVFLGVIPGISFMAVSIIGAGLNVCFLLIDVWRRSRAAENLQRVAVVGLFPRASREQPAAAGRVLLVVLLFAACFILFYESGALGWNTDALDHLSFIRRSVDGGELFPRDSFYKGGDGSRAFDPRKGLWHPVVSLWTYQADVDPAFLWRLLPSCLVFFALLSFVFFALELLGSGRRVALAVVFLLLFFRGEGIGWLTKMGFSRNMAQVILWTDVALLLRFYRLGGSWRLILAALLALIGTAYHIVFAFLLAVIITGMFLYALVHVSGARWRGRCVKSILILLPAVGIPLVVRATFTLTTFNLIHTHRQGMLVLSDTLAVVDPIEVLSRMGLVFFFAFALSPFIFRIAPDRKRRYLVGLLFLLPALLVFIPWTAVFMERHMGYLYYRLLYAAPVMCLLTLGIIGLAQILVLGRIPDPGRAKRPTGHGSRMRTEGGGRGGSRGSGRGAVSDRAASVGLAIVKRLVAAAAIALFLYFPVRFALNDFAVTVETILHERAEPDEKHTALIELLDTEIPDHSVIVSDPHTSYVISAFTDHFVVVILDQHCSPADAVALERLRAVRDIFSPTVALTKCTKWFVAFDADYLLLNTNVDHTPDFFATTVPGQASLAYEKFASCPGSLRERYDNHGFHLFEIVRETGGEAVDPRCAEALAAALPCEGLESQVELDTGYGIVLDALHVTGETFSPGDTIRGSICWKTVHRVACELPLEWTIRLDTGYPKGAFYRNWYGKQYRREVERRNVTRYRLTATWRLRSGYSHPDQWRAGDKTRQDFSLVLPERMAPGIYELRFTAHERPYLPNRRISDYLRDEDSMHGEFIKTVRIGTAPGKAP